MINRRPIWLASIILISLAAAILLTPRNGIRTARGQTPPDQRIIVDANQARDLPALQSSGGRTLVNYGDFLLLELPADQTVPEGAQVVEDLIRLRGLEIDTRSPDDRALAGSLLQTGPPQSGGFWLVHFAGPIRDEWLEGLNAQGLQIVAYLPENSFAVWGDRPDQRALQAAGLNPLLTWHGPYHPVYRLDERLRELAAGPAPAADLDVTVQIYRTGETTDTIARLTGLAVSVLSQPLEVLQFTNLSLRIPASMLAEIAALPDVFNVETYAQMAMQDEIQNQIMAGNLTTSAGKIVPSGSGYLNWLASKGFPTTQGSYPIVDVVDDGIDQGNASSVLHPDFYEGGSTSNPDRIVYLTNCTVDPTANGVGGHGNLNAGIMAGFNNLSGSFYEDAGLYNYGLGVSPYGRIAGTKVFSNAGSWSLSRCGNSEFNLVAQAYNNGTRITSNSWGDTNNQGAYTTYSQMYDILTRDAVSASSGNQQMLHVFAAGNAGSGSGTVLAPGTAKNVLTAGATENVRGQGISDGCVTSGDNADDVIYFSSRGPTYDSRMKPDIMAPGTHIQGPVSQDPAYNASGVCWGNINNKYYPQNGQTYYTWSSGTSHSTPAVAGAAQLAYEYYGRALNPGETPSPAMLKALLLNSPRYLTGLDANDTLPSPDQGWGDVDLGRLFDGAPRQIIDQSLVFGISGTSTSYTWHVADPTKPVRATLVWTDAPGTSVSAAYVNNLNLEVSIGGQLYRGNVFAGASSISGGSADTRNNVENIFLPAGQSGLLTVTVRAANIAGDGIPGNPDSTDQDFALVVYNAIEPLANASLVWNDSLGNNNGIVEPGDRLLLTVDLLNISAGTLQGVSAVMSPADGGSVVRQTLSRFEDIPAGETRSSLSNYIVDVNPNLACPGNFSLRLDVTTSAGGVSLVLPVTVSGCPGSRVTLLPALNLAAGAEGSAAIHTLTVTNTSGSPQTFNISLVGAAWPASAPAAVGPVAAGGSAQFSVTVNIPNNPAASADQVYVFVTSQSAASTRQGSILTTGTGIVYLPMIQR